MKRKIACTLTFLTIISVVLYGQEIPAKMLSGSWSGKLSIPNGPVITEIINFRQSDHKLFASFDVPEQFVKDGFIDSVWINNDSLFLDFSTRLGAGAIYKGLLIGSDSISGRAFQNGNSLPLNLTPTHYTYIQESHFNPKFEGFKIIKLITSTPTKDQQNTGTCWSHASTSFFETEAIRLGKPAVILSPMFYVVPTLIEKAERYIRLQGNFMYNEGDLTFSALKAYKEYGAVPYEVYSGKPTSSPIHEHLKLEKTLQDKLKNYVETGRGVMSAEDYKKSIANIIYKTIPKAPETFMYEGKSYTPKSFAANQVGINPDNYVEITSYTNHPFYTKFPLEIPSNWNNNTYLNVPLKDFTAIVDHALLNNYSVCWDGDIHEGYSKGFCRLPANTMVNDSSRQAAFDNYTTQDDHNMHIIGIAENKAGETFYIIKNSSAIFDCGGYVYMSKDYFRLRTISVMMHKDAIPLEIKKRM